MKRGHNFGVVYVTNPTVEEEQTTTKKKESIIKAQESPEKKKKQLEIEVPKPPKGRENLGVNTSPVASFVRPKPLTFEMGVQIDRYMDRAQIPLFWPEKTGIDVGTEILDGELFNFDEEVEPILNVLMSKIIEQSRMEVLEEEEIKEMKRKQREFEELRNRELCEVQKLEDKEARELAEKNRRVTQKKLEIENRIISQKKLFTRQFAKEYLSKLKINTINQLNERGVFRPVLLNQLENSLANHIFENTEKIHNNDYLVVNHLQAFFNNQHISNQKSAHLKSIENRQKKIKDLQRMKIEEEERKVQEKMQRKQERARLRREKEIQNLKNSIESEFLKKIEFVEMPENVFNVNANGQKKSYASAIGGYYGQLALCLTYFSAYNPDLINEEKMLKILESFIKSSPNFNIIYTQEDLDYYKTLDGGINTIEDILKLDDTLYADISKQIISKFLAYDELLIPLLSFCSKLKIEALNNIPLSNVRDVCELVVSCLMKLAKSPEPTINEKIKFLVKDNTVSDDSNYIAIGQIFPVSIPNVRTYESKKTKKINKTAFEINFPEKVAILPSISDKAKFLAFNLPFETMLRNNIIECMNKICKLDGDLEKTKDDFEIFYQEKVFHSYVEELAKSLNKEVLIFNDVDEIAQPSN